MKKLFFVSLLVMVLVLGTTNVYAAQVATNLALGAEVEVSSQWIDFPGESAVDGDEETMWAALEDMPWIKVTLANKAKVNKIILKYRPVGSNPDVDKISILNILFDDVVVETIEDYPNNDTPLVIDLPAKDVTEITFEVEEGIANPGFREIEIYAEGTGPVQTEAPGETNDPVKTNPSDPDGGDVKTSDPSMAVALAAFGATGLGTVSMYISKKKKNR